MNTIKLILVKLDEKYAKKWNETSTDFVHIYYNEKKVSDTLYRVGGFGVKENKPYFLLLKYIEALYPKHIIKLSKTKDRKHLKSQWCIIDNNGNEKINFKQFDSPYLHGDIIYSIDNKYYNIETGELYCESHNTMESEHYYLLNNQYDNDDTKRGVMKINKQDGTHELIQ